MRLADLLRNCGIIVAAWAIYVAVLSQLHRLGLPLGLQVGPMGEDMNWVFLLDAGSPGATAQQFWLIDSRNPLSPWWYNAFRPLLLLGENGFYLTRLLMNPLLGVGAAAMVHFATRGRAAGFSLAVGLLCALWFFNIYIDQIYWNFLGALGLSTLAVASFAAWIATGRRSTLAYGLSMVLWFGAFSTYLFQSGAIIAMAALSLLDEQDRSRAWQPGRWLRAAADILPHAFLFLLFVLIWRTVQEPRYETVLTPVWSLLPRQFLGSVAHGLTLSDLYRAPPGAAYPFGGFGVIATWLAGFLLCAGAVALSLARRARDEGPVRGPTGAAAPDGLRIAACAGALVLPTILIESLSPTWGPGTRWPMVYQLWGPFLLLGALAGGVLLLPLRGRARAMIWWAACASLAGLAVFLSVQHNAIQNAFSATERNLRAELLRIAGAARSAGQPVSNVIVLMDDHARWLSSDMLSERYASAWFRDGSLGFRVLRRGGDPAGLDAHPAGTVRIGDEEVENVTLDGRRAPLPQVAFARFDGSRLDVPGQLQPSDLTGFPVEWRRAEPILRSTLETGSSACGQAWTAASEAGAQGLRGAEADAGGFFRWMVANPAVIRMPGGSVGPARLDILIGQALQPRQLNSLVVRVGGAPVETALTATANGTLISGTVAPELLAADGPVEVELRIDDLRTVPGTTVRLGLALREVRLTADCPH